MRLSSVAIETYHPQYRPLSIILYLDVNPLPTLYTLFISLVTNRTACHSGFRSLLLCCDFLRLDPHSRHICACMHAEPGSNVVFAFLAQAEGITKGYRSTMDHARRLHYRSTQSPHGLPLACMHDILLHSYTPHVNQHLFRASMTRSCKWAIR